MSGCLSPKVAKHHSQDAGLEEVTAYPSWSDAPNLGWERWTPQWDLRRPWGAKLGVHVRTSVWREGLGELWGHPETGSHPAAWGLRDMDCF